MSTNISPLDKEDREFFLNEILKHNTINPHDFERFGVKKGLRNADGTGVMAGLTHVCSVEGYYMKDGEMVPTDGRLFYRGYDMLDIVKNCRAEQRFGYEEVAWLLLCGTLPTKSQLEKFTEILSKCRSLPDDFIEDVLMKNPSTDIMNSLARSVLALYSFDSDPDNISIDNVLRQSLQLIAQLPIIISYAYQVKRRNFYHKSMYIHPLKPEHNTAQCILNSLRSNKEFTDEEAKLLDTCLMIHAEHGGGNNSSFSTRVLTSSGTDTYSAIAAGIGSLKGPRHGGANIKASHMLDNIEANVNDITNEAQVADYLSKIIRNEAGDGLGLIYGMGHAVYTLSDPRAIILKEQARDFAEKNGMSERFNLIELVEALTPEVFQKVKGIKKPICANVDLYSGLVYKMLHIPEDLYTPIFATARIAGWSAHRIEELASNNKIMRPAYKSVSVPKQYVKISERSPEEQAIPDYVPVSERISNRLKKRSAK